MKRSSLRSGTRTGTLAAIILLTACSGRGPAASDEIALIRPGLETGFSNGGWNLDRYPGLAPLDAGARIVLADLKGPGVIRHIHLTRHHPAELFARGIVLEIWFDNAAEPAVMSPLADFFGDGGNGRAADFSADLIECAPWSYNGYFVMPFRTRARVVLRNDTDRDALDYSYVEWEKVRRWDDRYGYFHATYRRRAFRLLRDTTELFFEVRGSGHLLGRQFSVTTDEPLFRGFYYVMEGNNEVGIDGRERVLDYLGTEDSFTFSWGFRKTFAGRSAGMPLVEPGEAGRPASLSIFRFHDRMPLRFRRSLSWRIDWAQERHMHGSREFAEGVAKLADEPERLWIDYAAVFYWYQREPGGFAHVPLDPPAERRALVRHPNGIERGKRP
jgi:hypothetical protein